MNKIFFRIVLILSLFIVYRYCLSAFFPPDKISTFDGNVMTIDYHIIAEVQEKDRNKIQKIIDDTFHEVNQVYNKWNSESELSKLNRLKAKEVVEISKELENFLLLTEEVVWLSEGRFDPTIEPLQAVWKKHLEKGELPEREEVEKVLPAVGWNNIHFGNGKFYKDHDETSIDLGGIAKGYCVDLLVERIVAAGCPNVFVEWGGEIRVHGRHSDGRAWKVFVGRLNDMDPKNAIAHLELEDQSIATSGDYIQNWTIWKDGQKVIYSHIMDPKSGKPLESTQSGVASATVLAPSCVMADALATVAMMYPTLEEARDWAEQMSKKDARIKFLLESRDQGLQNWLYQPM